MKFLRLTIISLLISMSFGLTSFAQSTILPNPTDELAGGTKITDMTEKACLELLEIWLNSGDAAKEMVEKNKEGQEIILGCAIKSGKIKFWMVPFFIRNILQFAINIAVLISIFMIMLGAYYHIAGALSDDKQKGKTIITYALAGLVLTILSWTIVNILLLALTA